MLMKIQFAEIGFIHNFINLNIINMFDILSKLGEIKEKAAYLKEKISTQSYTGQDSKNLVFVKVNGKKDLEDISLQDDFDQLSKSEKEQAIKEAMNIALSQSESFIINELKSMIPNIPGMNIFG